MSDKKNIDRLFQEKFKDFEVDPNEQIWINIDAALREKKKRRIVPFWFKLTGIAAGLILGFFALNLVFNSSTSVENNPVVIGNQKQSNDKNSIDSQKNESVANTENSKEKNNTSPADTDSTPSSINQKTNSKNHSAAANNNAVANQNQSVKNKGNKGNKKANPANAIVSYEKSNAVATTSTQIEKTPARKKAAGHLSPSVLQKQNNTVANGSGTKAVKNKRASISKNAQNTNGFSGSEEDNAVALENKKSSHKAAVVNTPKDKKTQEGQSNSTIAENQKSTDGKNAMIKDNVPATALSDKIDKKDSTAVAAVEPNALEELQKKNEEEKNTIAEAKMNRWQITSNVAPIYFSSTSNGSPIDAQFTENNKSYENNLSFGVGVNYAVNKKLSVRTGVNKFTLGYSTNDVVFFAALDQVSFGSISSSAAGSTIQVVSQTNSAALRPFDNDVQNTNQGIMTQRMGYFEVPLEMSYKLIDKKFGVNVIGGLSTLFLNENEISVSSSTMSASLGKAKNLNDVHFSTNVGVGFKYRFWKSFEANFEPMFKYQINTFNKDAGNFKPYFIGLYSGVSFNF